MQRIKFKRVFLIFAIITLQINLFSQDWPVYQNDIQRSGISSMDLKSPLHLNWSYQAIVAPKPAWANPAKADLWHREANLKPRVIFDRANHVISVADKVYLGSSANDKVYCLDASTGAEIWSYFTGGPVRLAPSYADGLLYVGSDDGVVYCLNAENGKLAWKINTAEGKRFVPGNERVISISPVRTGVLIDDGTAYFCSGMFPNEGVELYAVDAKTGKVTWKKTQLDISPQGYMLASKENLYIPTGRTTPKIFSRKDGKQVGSFGGNGGTYALLVNDELIYGGGDEGKLNNNYATCQKTDEIATFLGLQIIVKDEISYLRSDYELSAIKRQKYIADYKDWAEVEDKKGDLSDELWDLREQRKLATDKEAKKIDKKMANLIEKISQSDKDREDIEAGGLIWKTKTDDSFSMILAGNTIIIGGNGKVETFEANSGKKTWSHDVDGIVYSLAVSNGNLLVSTSSGNIYSFSAKATSKPIIQKEIIVNEPYRNNDNTKLYQDAVNKILSKGIDKGYCLVVGSETGRLAYELASKTNLKVIGIEEDAEKVEKSRKLLNSAGIYGSKVSIIHGNLNNLPFSKYFANLIVSDKLLISDTIPTTANEIYRVLRPFGGVAVLGMNKKAENKVLISKWVNNSDIDNWKIEQDNWTTVISGKIDGTGEWTHLYSNPGNTSNSNDPVKGPLQIQWFGRPGPADMINRHSRTISTLFKDGRLFIPGNNRIICADAYNGTPLWKQYIPGMRILGAMKDCGTIAVADDYIYVATEQTALGFNVKNGKQEVVLEAPQLIPGQNSKWGYVAVVEDQIFGSGKKPNASFTVLGRINCDQFEGDYREMVTSDYLFSLNRITGKELWTYKGLVFNNTITIGDDYIYFVESRNKKAALDFDGRMRIDHFCEEPTFVVKLNKKTGKKEWEKKFKFPFSQIMFLVYSDNVLLVTGSYNKGLHAHYALYAFDGGTGSKIWEVDYEAGDTQWDNTTKKANIRGSHGEQWQHPVIIGEQVILPPYDFNLHTGKKGSLNFTRGGHGCGGITGSASHLFARGSNPRIYNIMGDTNGGDPISRVSRPGCWINIIPAGNIVSIPEASSGCTCDYPIQTSFVFISKD